MPHSARGPPRLPALHEQQQQTHWQVRLPGGGSPLAGASTPREARRFGGTESPSVFSARGSPNHSELRGGANPRAASGSPTSGRGGGCGGGGIDYGVLPPALHAALDDPLAMMALEDWHKTHHERPGQHIEFDSALLSCEARLRKLDHLSARLRPPNTVVTAVVVDLLRRVLATLPPALESLCKRLLHCIEGSVYSQEHVTGAELKELQEVLGHPIDRLPYFAVVRQQQAVYSRLEVRATELQRTVDSQMEQRRGVLEFIGRLQQDERLVIQYWLFRFWVLSFNFRRFQISKVATTMLATPQDILTPFLSWCLFVSLVRLERARDECQLRDKEASAVAQRITEVEMENSQQQEKLQASLDATALLKRKCIEEQQEHERLQVLWDAMQPELLLSVLGRSLELFFSLVAQTAKFAKLERRRRLAGKDAGPVSAGAGSVGIKPDLKLPLVRWVNSCLSRAREEAQKLMTTPSLSSVVRAQLEMVSRQEDIRNLGEDLSDSTALCALYAVLRAEADGRELSSGDLWPLAERDHELRAEHLWSLLPMLVPTAAARSLLLPIEVVAGAPDAMAKFLACLFLRHPALGNLPEGLEEKALKQKREQLNQLLTRMEALADGLDSDPPQDPTPLLHGGEDVQALAATSTEQLLLRWVNVQLQPRHARPVENFGSDLQDGEAIGQLLAVVAPEVVDEASWSEDPEERLEQIVASANRITDFELLSVNAVLEGHSDMLAAFFAQLFLTRPSLGARRDSLISMHLVLLEELCHQGLETLVHTGSEGESAGVLKMCLCLHDHWSDFTVGLQTVQAATATMATLNERMQTFLGDTLAHRAHGKPRAMLDAKEAREFLFYTSLNIEHAQALLPKEHIDKTIVSKIEELLRKHFRLLREIYRHYSGQAGGITLEGLMKLYQDCKLRTRDLAPHHIEVIYCDHVDPGSAGVLSPNQFILVLIRCAKLKFKDKQQMIFEHFSQLVENHLKPHACQEDAQNIFMRLAYDPKVRKVLDDHIKELKIVFLLYAMMDNSTTDAMQKVHTMNIKEFHMLLVDTDLLDDTLTEGAMQQIFDGIQTSATDENMLDEDSGADDDEGMDDDEELSFSEFLDGLVAIAAYKYPDPFTPFETRVNKFILQLFSLLRRHWSRKRISPKVDAMLNALQKKLR